MTTVEPLSIEAQSLIADAKLLSIDLSIQQVTQLFRLLDELADWNTRINLTAIRQRSEMIQKHLLDSLAVQPFLHGPVVIDVGTGAGFPGLPLAIINPPMRFILIDSIGKKLAFVRHCVDVLGLTNVEVVHTRAETYVPEHRAASVITRAFGSLRLMTEQAGNLCARSGRLLAMKGRVPTDEIDVLPHAWMVTAVERLQVPGLDQERHLVILERRP